MNDTVPWVDEHQPKPKMKKSVAFDIFKPPWVLKLLPVRFLLTWLHDVLG